MNILLFLILLLAAAYGCLMLVYWYGWLTLSDFDETRCSISGRTKVSVVIPTRNEEHNIETCLRAVTRQNYPAALFEVIVVNDHSTDATEEKVRHFPAPHVQLINLVDHLPPGQLLNSYKKKAIEIAISQASGQLIVTTDADCEMDEKWLETIVKFYETYQLKLIAAPVIFYKEDDFFRIFQSLDFMTLQGITGATARLRMGTLCNGANLAYEKEAFFRVGGFRGIDNIASGDDMLLMYKLYQAYPDRICFLKNQHAVVRTRPMDTLRSFLNQRIRWSSKAGKYDDKRITAVLTVVYCWNVSFLVLLIAGFFQPAYLKWWCGLLLYKTGVELFFLFPVAGFFKKTHLLVYFLLAQLLHIPYVIVAGWLGKFGTYHWKDRQVK